MYPVHFTLARTTRLIVKRDNLNKPFLDMFDLLNSDTLLYSRIMSTCFWIFLSVRCKHLWGRLIFEHFNYPVIPKNVKLILDLFASLS